VFFNFKIMHFYSQRIQWAVKVLIYMFTFLFLPGLYLSLHFLPICGKILENLVQNFSWMHIY
jgi:hypothetical protein